MAEEEAQEKEVEEKKGGSNLVLIIAIVGVVLILVIGGIVAVLLMSGGDEEAVDAPTQQQSAKSKAKRGSNDTVGLVVGPMYPLQNFTVNLLSDSGRRFLKAQVNLELSGEELQTEIETKVPVVRDLVIRILTSKTLEEVSTAKGKDKLKEQLVDELNLRLQDGYIQNIYFTEFVVQ